MGHKITSTIVYGYNCDWAHEVTVVFVTIILNGHNHVRLTIVGGHNRAWAQLCMGKIVWGINHVWAQTCLATNLSGHKRVRAQSCTGTVMWSQSCGYNHVWAQTWWNPSYVSFMLRYSFYRERSGLFNVLNVTKFTKSFTWTTYFVNGTSSAQWDSEYTIIVYTILISKRVWKYELNEWNMLLVRQKALKPITISVVKKRIWKQQQHFSLYNYFRDYWQVAPF